MVASNLENFRDWSPISSISTDVLTSFSTHVEHSPHVAASKHRQHFSLRSTDLTINVSIMPPWVTLRSAKSSGLHFSKSVYIVASKKNMIIEGHYLLNHEQITSISDNFLISSQTSAHAHRSHLSHILFYSYSQLNNR